MKIFTENKILWHGAQIAEWQSGGNPYPIVMEVDPSGACNGACPRCVGGEHKGMLELSMFETLMDELVEETEAIIFTGGGEPTLNPALGVMITEADALGYDTALITNGLKMSCLLAKTVIECCKWVRVSLDAGTPEMYKITHNGTQGEFNRVCDTITRLVDAKKDTGSSCTVGIGYLVDNFSINGMEDVMARGRVLGVDYLQFRPVYLAPWFDGPDGIDIEAYRKIFRRRIDHGTNKYLITQSAVKFDKLARHDLDRKYSFCHGQQFCGVVTATGDVVLCCLMRGVKGAVLGNIYKEAFYDIWNGKRRQEVLKNLNMAEDCPPLCRCDGINEMLEKLKETPAHVHFL
jgi:MoaA/NifB/PqqE/SkfB family radical SAM enzyme